MNPPETNPNLFFSSKSQFLEIVITALPDPAEWETILVLSEAIGM